jgi:hypothetical protein
MLNQGETSTDAFFESPLLKELEICFNIMLDLILSREDSIIEVQSIDVSIL